MSDPVVLVHTFRQRVALVMAIAPTILHYILIYYITALELGEGRQLESSKGNGNGTTTLEG